MLIQAPYGGRIHRIVVSVNPERSWKEAIDVLRATDKDSNIYKVGNLYPLKEGQAKDEEILLVNFGSTTPSGEYVVDWARPGGLRGLKPADPRKVFAIGEHTPLLCSDLMQDPIAVVSLASCSFEGDRLVPYVWWNQTRRHANLIRFDSAWSINCWFAFTCEW